MKFSHLCFCFILLFHSLVACFSVFAADSLYTVSGTVVTRFNKKTTVPVPFVHVSVMNENGCLTAKATSQDDGSFRFMAPKGRYKIYLECIGYKSLSIGLDVGNGDIAMGDITMIIGEELQAASIEAKTLIHRSGSRITYDVYNDPDKTRINMTEMISRIPGLKLAPKDGELVFDHQKIQQILIDEEENGLINRNRQYPMEFIKAHYMKNVVVVLPGDAQYKNEAPILLINLAQKLPFGVAGQQSISASTQNSYSPSLDAVVNSSFIGIGIRYGFSYSKAPVLTDEYYTNYSSSTSDVSRTENIQSSISRSYSHILSTNLFRKFAKDRISFNATLNTITNDAVSSSESVVRNYSSNNSILSEVNTVKSGHSKSPFRFNGAARLSGSFGEKIGRGTRRKNTWMIEYSYKDKQKDVNNDYSEYEQIGLDSQMEHRVNAKASFNDAIRWPIPLSFDLKSGFYYREYSSSTQYESIIGTITKEASGFDYTQQVVYGNLSISGDVCKDVLVYFNSNLEQLSNEGCFMNGSIRSPLDYSSFTINPTVGLLSYWRSYNFRMEYNHTVRRPDIKQLNPYEDYINPFYIRRGNPNLRGQSSDGILLECGKEFSSTILKRISLSSIYSRQNELISPVTMVTEDGVSISSYENCGRSCQFSSTFCGNFDLTKTMKIRLLSTYSWCSFNLPSGITNSYHSITPSLNYNWDAKFFSFNMDLRIKPRSLTSQSSNVFYDPYLALSVSRYFKKPKIGVSVDLNDALRSGGRRETLLEDVGFVQRSLRESLGRYLSFRVYWRFGAFKNVKSVEVEAYDM